MIPELQALDSRRHLLRIPPGVDVPLTPRVRRLIDSAPFRRLATIRQLGLVALVYPGATHSRFEHSLGVYRNALLYLQRLRHDERFVSLVTLQDQLAFLCAALFHDLGHWPFAHPMEDMQLPGLERHERRAASLIDTEELRPLLESDWGLPTGAVNQLLLKSRDDLAGKLLGSMLSGPIDIDKVDYLFRDSLHAGVPYGRSVDPERLIGSLCLNRAGDGLAITEKGRTAAEMLVFSRYIMFSEVYWHHTVRAATAMFQRGIHLLPEIMVSGECFQMSDDEFIRHALALASGTAAEEIFLGLFGPRRRLFKRAAELSALQAPELHQRLAHRSYAWLVQCAEHLAEEFARRLRRPVPSHHVLVDAPPQKLEVQFQVDMALSGRDEFLPLKDVSPVVRALAEEQFDRYVKRVRILVDPTLADEVRSRVDVIEVLDQVLGQLDDREPDRLNTRSFPK